MLPRYLVQLSWESDSQPDTMPVIQTMARESLVRQGYRREVALPMCRSSTQILAC